MNKKELLRIYKDLIGIKGEDSEELINILLAMSEKELYKNRDEPLVNANRVVIGTLMCGQDSEYYICQKRTDGSHFWSKY